jgi:transcription elongation factor Elf1
MHLSDCPRCGRRELRGTRSLHTVTTRRGNVFASTCRGCGAELSASTNRVLRPSTMDAVA